MTCRRISCIVHMYTYMRFMFQRFRFIAYRPISFHGLCVALLLRSICALLFISSRRCCSYFSNIQSNIRHIGPGNMIFSRQHAASKGAAIYGLVVTLIRFNALLFLSFRSTTPIILRYVLLSMYILYRI